MSEGTQSSGDSLETAIRKVKSAAEDLAEGLNHVDATELSTGEREGLEETRTLLDGLSLQIVRLLILGAHPDSSDTEANVEPDVEAVAERDRGEGDSIGGGGGERDWGDSIGGESGERPW